MTGREARNKNLPLSSEEMDNFFVRTIPWYELLFRLMILNSTVPLTFDYGNAIANPGPDNA